MQNVDTLRSDGCQDQCIHLPRYAYTYCYTRRIMPYEYASLLLAQNKTFCPAVLDHWIQFEAFLNADLHFTSMNNLFSGKGSDCWLAVQS